MPIRGKLLIIGILGAAVAAAAFAWWFQYQQGRRILELWGADAAYRIRMAPETYLCQLESEAPQTSHEPTASRLQIGDQSWIITRRIDLGKARGLVHARQALIQDASYDWAAASQPDAATPNWKYLLEFRDQDKVTRLILDLPQGWIRDVDRDGPLASVRPIAEGLATFFAEQAALNATPNAADSPTRP